MPGFIRSARINGGSEIIRRTELVQFNNGEGHLIIGSVTDIHRAHGTIYLQLDGIFQVEAWHARKATPLITVSPGCNLVLRAPLQVEGGEITAGTVVQITTWRLGKVGVFVANYVPSPGLLFSVQQSDLVKALLPGKDPRLVAWSR